MRYRRHDPSADAPIDPNAVMELWLGPSHNGSLFRDREELRQAWELARDYMLKTFGRPGRRPRAFYAFEWDGLPPPYDRVVVSQAYDTKTAHLLISGSRRQCLTFLTRSTNLSFSLPLHFIPLNMTPSSLPLEPQ